MVENEKGDLDPDSHSTLAVWRKHFSQLFYAYGVSVVTQIELPSADPLVAEMNALEFEMPIEKLKGHQSPGIDQLPIKLMKAGGRTICY
jgi:hypothetical protein